MATSVFDFEGTAVFGYVLFALGLAPPSAPSGSRTVPSLIVASPAIRSPRSQSALAPRALPDTLHQHLAHQQGIRGPAPRQGLGPERAAERQARSPLLAVLRRPSDMLARDQRQRRRLDASCLARHGAGYNHAVYQPASRFWLFQGIETALFGGVAVRSSCSPPGGCTSAWPDGPPPSGRSYGRRLELRRGAEAPQHLGHVDAAVALLVLSISAIRVRDDVTAVPFRVCRPAAPPASRRKRASSLRAWKSVVLEHDVSSAVTALPGQPDLDVVFLRRRRAEVARGDVHDAVVQAELIGELAPRSRAGTRARPRNARVAEREHLDLLELMRPEDPPGVLARRAGLAAEAGGQPAVAARELLPAGSRPGAAPPAAPRSPDQEQVGRARGRRSGRARPGSSPSPRGRLSRTSTGGSTGMKPRRRAGRRRSGRSPGGAAPGRRARSRSASPRCGRHVRGRSSSRRGPTWSRGSKPNSGFGRPCGRSRRRPPWLPRAPRSAAGSAASSMAARSSAETARRSSSTSASRLAQPAGRGHLRASRPGASCAGRSPRPPVALGAEASTSPCSVRLRSSSARTLSEGRRGWTGRAAGRGRRRRRSRCGAGGGRASIRKPSLASPSASASEHLRDPAVVTDARHHGIGPGQQVGSSAFATAIPSAAQLHHLAVVLAVPDGDRLRGREAQPLRDERQPAALETPGAANSRKYGSDLAMNARLPKRGCNSSRSAFIASGVRR